MLRIKTYKHKLEHYCNSRETEIPGSVFATVAMTTYRLCNETV